jgi:hypothetical protein
MGDWLSGLGFSNAPRPARPQPPLANETPRKGRRRKSVLVPCCEECDGHYIRILRSDGDVVTLECRECGFTWKDTCREVIGRPRR